MKNFTENSAPPKQLKTLKRKVGYANEEVSKTHTKLDRMAINKPTEKVDKVWEKESKEKSILD